MNTTELKGNWNVLKGHLKQRYAELTDDDLVYVEGAEDELFGRLQIKLGKTKQQILESKDAFELHKTMDWGSSVSNSRLQRYHGISRRWQR